MKIKFLNQTITITNSDRPLPVPFYDVNYAYKIIYISSHLNLNDLTNKEMLNDIILRGCIDISMNSYPVMGSGQNPVYDYLLSKINILNEVYDYKDGKMELPYKGGNK
jgi:hypothetical protein